MKQKIAWDFLHDKKTTEVFYGGGAGGGKSWLGCLWLVISAFRYPGTRYLLGRAVLKSLKESTLLTFFEVCKYLHLTANVDFKYNAQSNVIIFANGSEVYLKDLYCYPSDPEFDSLGSTEYTFAFIDEASQITKKARDIVMSRLRYKLDEFDLVPKTLMTANPCKNFLYYDFYLPHKKSELVEYRQFVPALVGDNPFISEHYIRNLEKLDQSTKERLLFGNFEYDDDPATLIHADAIGDLFTNPKDESKDMAISCDVARFGADKTVIFVWAGLSVIDFQQMKRSSMDQVRDALVVMETKYKVGRSKQVVDEDGIGGGVIDIHKGAKGFIANKAPIRDSNYKNLKGECYYKLAEYINGRKISICCDLPSDVQEELIKDLQQVKAYNYDRDEKRGVVPKEQVSKIIGRSPDYSDALMMRMLFELRSTPIPTVGGARVFA